MFVTALSTVAGVALILVGMRDMVHELFHPEESGSISTWVMERVWDGAKLVGRRFPGALSRAGPVIIFSVVGMWVLIFALGWALIYMPHIGDSSGGLALSGTLPGQARGHFWT